MGTHHYRIVFFIGQHQFFELLTRLAATWQLGIVFQRFVSDAFEAGVHVVPPAVDMEVMYQAGDFRKIYLSVGGLPQHEKDWDFIVRSVDELIRIDVGRSAPGQIECSEVYLLGKSNRAREVFNALEREFAASCHRGVRGSRHAYPNHYWSEEVRSLALYRALGNENTRYWVVEP